MAVTRLEIHSIRPFAGGAVFGDTGPYRQIDGIVHLAVDPNHPANGPDPPDPPPRPTKPRALAYF